MDKTPQHLAFLTVKEGEIQLERLRELYQSMVSKLYKGIVADQIVDVAIKLEELRKKEKPRGVSVSRILEHHYVHS